MKVDEFVRSHFKGIENETWYPAIVAIADGYAKYLSNDTNTSKICISGREFSNCEIHQDNKLGCIDCGNFKQEEINDNDMFGINDQLESIKIR